MPDRRAIVFAGPTIGAEEVRTLLPGALVLPPVAQGDVYRATREGPDAIGIIDGVFDVVPSVWHKEILFAIDRGIPVFGSASMGALRASELDAFGMIGVGDIYAAYRDGTLEDDDEVAIAHGTAENNFRELSDAMVNIRATTTLAMREGVIDRTTGALLEQAAKTLFYPERTFPAAVAGAAALGARPSQLEAFRAWLPHGRVNAKRDDARRMLAEMREGNATGEPPSFRFEHTVFFSDLAASARWDHQPGAAGPVAASPVAAWPSADGGLLEELRLQPGVWTEAIRGATLRALAEREAHARGLEVSNEALTDVTLEFRRRRELHDTGDLLAWLQRHDLDGRAFIALMENETRVEWLLGAHYDDALEHLADELRASARWTAFRNRARDKARWLDVQGLSAVPLDHLGLRDADLFTWHFARLGRDVPGDLCAYARAAGFDDVEHFRRAVARDYLFVTRRGDGPHTEELA